ncbi:MAG TPA: hypothetical protein VEY08_11875, partial [Chloroflexia bacterium]|nr:hypothetical protein [Chloroflexia bacterium]
GGDGMTDPNIIAARDSRWASQAIERAAERVLFYGGDINAEALQVAERFNMDLALVNDDLIPMAMEVIRANDPYLFDWRAA